MDSHSLTRKEIKQKRKQTPEGMGYCCLCDQYKSLDEFGISTTRRTGISVYCKLCLRAYDSLFKKSPEQQEKRRLAELKPERKEKSSKYNASPERKEKRNAHEKSIDGQIWRTLYRKSPERVARRKELSRSPDSKAKLAEYKREKKYGMTQEAYDALIEKQGGLCAICGLPETATFKGTLRTLCVDHDHDTGAIRGLLCSLCNQALGFFKDSPENLSNAIDYLMGFNR